MPDTILKSDMPTYNGALVTEETYRKAEVREELTEDPRELIEKVIENPRFETIQEIKSISREKRIPLKVVVINYAKQRQNGPMSQDEFRSFLDQVHKQLHSNINGEKPIYKIANPEPEYFFDDGSFQIKKAGDHLRRIYDMAVNRETEEIMVYENGFYKRFAEDKLKEGSNRFLDYLFKRSYQGELIEQAIQREYIPVSEIDSHENIVNTKNCLLDVENWEVKPHNPEKIMTTQLNVEFDPEAECPKFKSFLDDLVDNEEKKKKLQEMFGYSLLKDQRMKKAFLLHGRTDSGKTTLLKILTELLGKENTSHVDLQQFNESRFLVGRLFGKLANIGGELPDKSIKNIKKFDKLTGEDRIKGENKREDPFFFQNRATLIFATNNIPKLDIRRKNRDSFYNRWIIIEFPYRFTEENDQHKDQVKNVTEPIKQSDEEMSGILNWALEGLHRLDKEGKFTGQRSIDEIQDLYEQNSDPISHFLRKKTERGEYIEKKLLYEAFQNFTELEDIPNRSYQQFAQEVAQEEFVDTGRKGKDKVPVFQGIQLKDNKWNYKVIPDLPNPPMTLDDN